MHSARTAYLVLSLMACTVTLSVLLIGVLISLSLPLAPPASHFEGWESIAVKHLDLANEETWKRYTIKMQVGETSWRAKHDSLVGRMGVSVCLLDLQ